LAIGALKVLAGQRDAAAGWIDFLSLESIPVKGYVSPLDEMAFLLAILGFFQATTALIGADRESTPW
jgi:hypothetical protein